jgi:hypothetical protein
MGFLSGKEGLSGVSYGSQKTRGKRRKAREERGEPICQDSPPHFHNTMGGRDLFGTNPHALKDGIATPHATLAIYGLEDLFKSPVSGISEETINLGQYGRPHELGVPSKSGACSIADSAEDTVNVWVDFLPLILIHYVLQEGWHGFSVKTEFHVPAVVEERGEIDDEVSNDREVGEGFDESCFSQETFDRCSAGQD